MMMYKQNQKFTKFKRNLKHEDTSSYNDTRLILPEISVSKLSNRNAIPTKANLQTNFRN